MDPIENERKPVILLADDEPFQRLFLVDILEGCNYEVVVAENGLQAMEQMRNENNEFDLLLLDLAMPEMDGLEVLSLMAEDDRL